MTIQEYNFEANILILHWRIGIDIPQLRGTDKYQFNTIAFRANREKSV